MKSSTPSHPLAPHFTEHGLAFDIKEDGEVLVSGFGLENVSPSFVARFNPATFLLVVQVVLPLRAPASQLSGSTFSIRVQGRSGRLVNVDTTDAGCPSLAEGRHGSAGLTGARDGCKLAA